MADVHEVLTQPMLVTDSDDPMTVRRIDILEHDIQQTPEVYMAAVATLGAISPEITGVNLTKGTPEAKERLTQVIRSSDFRELVFDDDSDGAIFSHPAVKDGIRRLHMATGRQIKAGRDQYRHEENAQAEQLKYGLNALKLFLYMRRVKQWQQAGTTALEEPHAPDTPEKLSSRAQ